MSAPGGGEVVVERVWKSFGDTAVLQDVSVRVAAGGVLALLGPSGCGKTTLLRTIAGLERPDAGEVRVGGRVLTGEGTFVPPERRQVGMVFQDWALFPHLNVAANVGYGVTRREARAERVAETLAMVGMTGMGERLPGTLSGGQQQRVALARALAPHPTVLLLDEPFSNLDTTLRTQVRSEVHALLDELDVTTVFVTHDQDEAFVLGDEVAVMHDGRMEQQAPPSVVYRRPSTPWVAGFVGEANLLPGAASGDTAETAVGPVTLEDPPATGAVVVLLRPEHLRLEPGGGCTVTHVEYYGHDTLYRASVDGTSLRVRAGGEPRHQKGDAVTVTYAGGPTVAWEE